VRDGRIVVETAVPGCTLSVASRALERLGRHVAIESCREHGIPVREDQHRDATERREAA
jgi:hypothetical protein